MARTLSSHPAPDDKHPVDRILDAVRSMRAGAGDANLSYRTIAKRAGLSSGTVSYYFSSKAALLEAALDRFHVGIAEILRPWLRVRGPNPGHMSRRMMRHLFRNEDDVRLRLAAWVESWGLPEERLAETDRFLTLISASPWMGRWSKTEKRVIIQGLVWAAQRYAALSEHERAVVVGIDDPDEAREVVIETMGKLAEALAANEITPAAVAS
ncbi:MAG: TetR/AcrR family transcriptional regulator [Deltaproteobacteria bacterium]|nr:TetR/AcrR family transcriptional regulator [Deltaproteobacteria bacterium]